MVLRLGTKDKLDIQVLFKKEEKQDKESLNLMVAIIKVSSLTASLKEKENITLPILEKYTRVIFQTIICMDRVLWFGQTNQDMMVNLEMVKWKDTV